MRFRLRKKDQKIENLKIQGSEIPQKVIKHDLLQDSFDFW